MPRMTAVKGVQVKIGKYKLVEKDLYCDGMYEETICEVLTVGGVAGVYCSINDAIRHKGEWYKDIEC